MLRAMGVQLWSREGMGTGIGQAPAIGPKQLVHEARTALVDLERRDDSAETAVVDLEQRVDQPGSAVPARSPDGAPEHRPPARADWLIVADGVDPSDAASGAGQQLLDNMLRAIGVSRTAPTPFTRAAVVSPTEHGNDFPALIAAVGPRCIVAFGRQAAQVLLTSDEPLGALRERRQKIGGVPAIATFGLAFLLRNPAEKAKAWADLCRAVRAFDDVPG